MAKLQPLGSGQKALRPWLQSNRPFGILLGSQDSQWNRDHHAPAAQPGDLSSEGRLNLQPHGSGSPVDSPNHTVESQKRMAVLDAGNQVFRHAHVPVRYSKVAISI